MTGDQQTLLFKVLLFVAIAAFYPQIARWWRKRGYRQESEFDSTSPRRLGWVFLAVVGFFVAGALIEGLSKLF